MSSLDEKGRCCGRKPLAYKRPHHLFCFRCDKAFNPQGQQIENWAYKKNESGEFIDITCQLHQDSRNSR